MQRKHPEPERTRAQAPFAKSHCFPPTSSYTNPQKQITVRSMEISPRQLHSQSSDTHVVLVARPRRRPTRRAQQGASLIEIMVVLVILLIGVFLAIRIFPTGFATLRSSENRTSATRLSQRMLSLAKGDAAENLPQGVLAAYKNASTGQLVVDTSQDPDDLGEYTKGSPNPYFDDVNHFRFIKGEQVKIPLPTAGTVDGKNGSAYTLKFGPIYMDQTVGQKNNVPTTSNIALYNSYLTVTGSPLTPISGQTSDTKCLSSPSWSADLRRGLRG